MRESEIINNISDNMKYYMALNNINSVQLSKKIGCSARTIRRIKYGETTTTLCRYMKIADVMNVTLNDLVGIRR